MNFNINGGVFRWSMIVENIAAMINETMSQILTVLSENTLKCYLISSNDIIEVVLRF